MHLIKDQLATLCREYGPGLHLPPGLDGVQGIKWAAVSFQKPVLKIGKYRGVFGE